MGSDIVFVVHESYVEDHGAGLSTAWGHNDTSLSPIFLAVGPGINRIIVLTVMSAKSILHQPQQYYLASICLNNAKAHQLTRSLLKECNLSYSQV